MSLTELQPLLKTINMNRSRFLYGLDCVPDDRQDWSPGGAAHTPLQVAGRAAGFLQFLSHIIRERTMPERPGDPAPAPTDRAAARAAVDAAFGRLQASIEALTEADLTQPVPTPMGETIPLREMLGWVNGLIGYQQGQLNYLQLAYGDTDPNMPPEWQHPNR